LDDVFKARRWAPLEFVNFHFLISGVTRAFTHQMVWQRTAVYAQESVRFAVKEDVPVALPASLDGTMRWADWLDECARALFPADGFWIQDPDRYKLVHNHANTQATKEQLWRREWDDSVKDIATSYNALVNAGMPAEDARGLLPTNLQTRIHYSTNLRNLYEHAGNRLCTQAQHEWKVVWRLIIGALREYGCNVRYRKPEDDTRWETNSAWQFEELVKVFKPICYQTGKCEFMSSADRYCAIRDRVQANHVAGVPSSEWEKDRGLGHVLPIYPVEWLENHAAARIS
jgi:flavin-dependent thymidylate synthase